MEAGEVGVEEDAFGGPVADVVAPFCRRRLFSDWQGEGEGDAKLT